MPKVKKQEESDSGSGSDSDSSGPKDRNPPKKAKTEDSSEGKEKGGAAGTSSGKKNKDGDIQFELERNRFVTVREFRGKTLIDVREFYDAGGELKPGKKGICMTPSQWQKLKSLIPEIDKAVKDM